jgi:hypothetical protein
MFRELQWIHKTRSSKNETIREFVEIESVMRKVRKKLEITHPDNATANFGTAKVIQIRWSRLESVDGNVTPEQASEGEDDESFKCIIMILLLIVLFKSGSQNQLLHAKF